jgi:hypothetical protein
VQPLTVVPRLDVFEDRGPRLFSSLPVGIVHQSHFNVAMKLSETALSQQLPLRLMLQIIPSDVSMSW